MHNFYVNSFAVFCGGAFKEPRQGYNTTFLQTIGVTVEDYEKGSWFGNSSLAADEIFQKAVISPKGLPQIRLVSTCNILKVSCIQICWI